MYISGPYLIMLHAKGLVQWIGLAFNRGREAGMLKEKKKLLTGRRSRQFVDLQGQILREYMRPLWGLAWRPCTHAIGSGSRHGGVAEQTWRGEVLDCLGRRNLQQNCAIDLPPAVP